eukprot:Seg3015.1 transcript_id=Seg3015.1/GoldUCD/mRNA.D3Y31 product="hypothetical protein" pseudo=true protein_id=Seg3015.1/GoldUCD/D3Y31
MWLPAKANRNGMEDDIQPYFARCCFENQFLGSRRATAFVIVANRTKFFGEDDHSSQDSRVFVDIVLVEEYQQASKKEPKALSL